MRRSRSRSSADPSLDSPWPFGHDFRRSPLHLDSPTRPATKASARLVAALAASAALAAAQNSPPGGTVGVWDHIQPNNNGAGINPYPGSPTNPLTSLWSHSAFGEAAVFVAGNDASGAANLFAFDVVSWIWTPFASKISNFQSADLFFYGGFALAAGGTTDDFSQQLNFIQTTVGPTNSSWLSASMTGVPSAHDGHRLITLGGLLYMIGGFTQDATRGWEASNAMWAADLAGFFASPNNGPGDPGATIAWSRVQPINAPGVFSGRGAFSVVVYSATIVLFGGLTRTLPGPSGPDPVCALPNSNCVTYNDVWFYQPGLMAQPLDSNLCGGGNCGWSQASVSGANVPPGRYGHAAGVLADNMYIFGGVSSSGVFYSDLWVFNIEDLVWVQATSSFRGISGLPSLQTFFPSMSVVGHHLYVEMTGDTGGHAIYRWVPEARTPSGGGGGNNGNSGTYDAIAQGHTAGIVMGIMLGIANTAFLYVVFVRTGGFAKLMGGSAAPPSAAYSAMENL